MVATRRGTRAASSATKANDEATETPVFTRTRHRTGILTTPSQSEHPSDSQQDEAEEQSTALAEPETSAKLETRGAKCQPTDKQPESTHEADVSESESCCSVASDIQLVSRSRRRATVRVKASSVEEMEVSKTESSSSSLTKTPRRSTRVQKKPVPVLGSSTSQEDEHSEAESCSSVASLYTRVTRSCRKPADALKGATHSEADSCSSVVSGPQGSTVRRSTRCRVKVTESIPIHLEHSETAEAAAPSKSRRTRGCSGKAKSAEEGQAYESEGCQSGPSLSPRRTTRTTSRAADSDSESVLTSLDSPCSTQGKGTPCSSRTGSASSNCAVRFSRSKSVRVTVNVLKMPVLVSKSVKKDSVENESENDQAETTQDIPVSSTKSDMEDVEEMEEDVNNKTVFAADQECFVVEDNNRDLTLCLDEAEAGVRIKPESSQDISSKTENDVEIADEAMDTHEASSVQEVQAVEEESSSISVTHQKSVKRVDHKPQSNLAVESDTKVRQSSELPVHEENLKVLSEPEKKMEVTKKLRDAAADEGTITIDQDSSEEEVMEDTTNNEGPSSSKASKESIEKSKPVTVFVSLLDSSADEESDDDGLSVDGGNDKAVDLESEEDVCRSEDQPGPSAALDSLTGNRLFVIDARPGCQPSEKYYIDTKQKESHDYEKESKVVADEEDFVDEEGDDDNEEDEDEDSKILFSNRKLAMNELSSSIDPGFKIKSFGGLYINFDGSKTKSVSDNLKKLKEQKKQDELLKKSVIVAGFEKKDSVPPYKESKHAAKLKRREEKAKTTGDGWFNMRAPEVTGELANDLKALQMRSAMDPKRFYKKNDRDGFPKYFQVGTVVDNPIDFYHSRIPKKERKRTIVEELLADAEFRSFNKRKYREIMAEKAAAAAGKMNKKKHKFQKKK
ncbi:deoxynucleotidyltransferase terminal-interacting protein 2 [Tachysurus fulvidraco]|uniref:deoxynucleotidyltransferase terminal-interacting protein 2 n=1 Tax=Tachysurus fulvidraco TaxID=1234273 RepID=UPI000F5162CF|nr:deoxynucleotidyltransferase terminal-interacting protein 2 [Tachysurus fulvidraco]XP_047678883.1 deoxynucleotidyltransferase terminal-interacting protein 2 [Tachysurus fulvidraco]XP_047678884.1 deoxynucleotidyltransferase terminal-interacting protein 2 [Tachysurus fulvidraco]